MKNTCKYMKELMFLQSYPMKNMTTPTEKWARQNRKKIHIVKYFYMFNLSRN